MSGKAVIVTGGAGGIGLAVATRLKADGFAVVIADRDADAARQAAAGIGADWRVLDIAEEGSVVATVGEVAQAHGGLAAVINNAGVHMQSLVVETKVEDWDRIHTVNARGTFLMCREAARVMGPQGEGQIVNIVTRLGYGNPFSSVYMSSKNAVAALTQCLAVEMAATGVRVNAVAPGHVGVGTGMEAAFRKKAEKLGKDWDSFEKQVIGSIPLGRWCKPEDVAGAVSWLLGPDADFVTGEVISITGGFQAYGISPDRQTVLNAIEAAS
ncbi:SDR family oxidoreductase [Shinella yambaruensis]|uniref:Beta-ketoacyl-ACP reductase n=1 Tax=Shinella yambaruensis TaxID=415996 RepID=A0ABQ5ZP61_9HYPH|nr:MULTISPECIES: SDR family oxidoreductase [Shinella]CAI0339680.1 putative 2-(S)-hydroxypropyl-CoM dehydrogenase [Rhizobiaceae bacterium]CAK7258072.1 Short-chain dehydrogenase [Shinella sp. WSC3-e]MCJ8028394.1 SDR family oxidoreductase [Shinella yambaruensis]MCO5140186.1 SDR family oxidoreductase [Shinella sp.]MCU7981447.1 SDR family oxidoreductase [Shinella yambaruensis]